MSFVSVTCLRLLLGHRAGRLRGWDKALMQQATESLTTSLGVKPLGQVGSEAPPGFLSIFVSSEIQTSYSVLGGPWAARQTASPPLNLVCYAEARL